MNNNNNLGTFYNKQMDVYDQPVNKSNNQFNQQQTLEQETVPKNRPGAYNQNLKLNQNNSNISSDQIIAQNLIGGQNLNQDQNQDRNVLPINDTSLQNSQNQTNLNINQNNISNNNVVGYSNQNFLGNDLQEEKFDLRKSQFYNKNKKIDQNIQEIQSQNFQFAIPQQHQQQYQQLRQEGGDKPEQMLKSLYYTKGPADDYIKTIQAGGHPYAIFFHCIFKFLALFFHLFLAWFVDQYTVYEIVIILNAFDFWTVKNITGRLLVGLRWWSEPMPDGEDKYVFECHIEEKKEQNINDTVFWGVQGISFLVWGIFFVVNVLAIDISKCVTILFALQASGINLYAYYKCSRVQKERIKDFATRVGADIAYKMMNQTVKLPVNW